MAIDLAPEILWGGLSVLVLICVNALLGMWAAWVAGEFDVRELPRFLREHVLGDVGPLFILGAGSLVQPEVKLLYVGCAAALSVKYLAKIKDKLAPKPPVEPEV